MDLSFYATHTKQEVLSSLNVSPDLGLSDQQVDQLQKQYGRNVLTHQNVVWLQIFVRQLKSPFVYLLSVAMVLSFALGELLSGCMILVFTMVNVCLGFYQEYHAEHTLKLLKNLITFKVNIRRNGHVMSIKTDELVVGDIVLFEPGDVVPADVRLIEAQDLTVDQSVLTGESVAVVKQTDPIGENKDLLAASNLAFCGTMIATGNGTGVVIAIGGNSMFGHIADVAQKTQRESIFAHEIKKFGGFMLCMIVGTLTSILLLHVFIKGSSVHVLDFTLFVIALAVTIIPEALPVVISFCLARGALQMARNNVVVRRLSAIEDLGGVQVLCVDKTGTLTENKMEVVDIYGNSKDVLMQAVCSNSVMPGLDNVEQFSFDGAVIAAFKAKNIPIIPATRTEYLSYDQNLLCVHAVIKHDHGSSLIIRGAFEKILDRCDAYLSGSRDQAAAWVRQQGLQGNRILAVASKEITQDLSSQEIGQQKNFTLLGMIAFADPIKLTVTGALAKAKKLGVIVKVITGDACEVAGAVAQKIGLIAHAQEVIVGAALEAMSQEEQQQAIEQYAVFARISPMQKLSIVKTLQQKYNVGFLGEGVNDAPALKLAHVALVVENASNVAKDAADIVLLKKSLTVIVDGIEEGRKIFCNTVKYLNVNLASNFSNFYTMALVSLWIDFLPMLPLQILLVDLLSDFPMISIASDTVDWHDIQGPQNFNFRQIIVRATVFGLFCSIFDFMLLGLFVKTSSGLLQTSWFIFSILSEIAFFYTIRSSRFFIFAGLPSLPIVILSVISCVLACILPLTNLGQSTFKFVAPGGMDYGKIIVLVVFFFFAVELVKYFYYRWIKLYAKG